MIVARNFILAASSIIFAFTGCSSGEQDAASKEKDAETAKNLDGIHAAYQAYSEKNGRPPARRSDLIEFLPEGTDQSSVFRSSRDQQDFVIIWGVDLNSLQQQAKPVVIAYEKKGSGGERHVLTSMGLLTYTDEEFASATFAQGHKP